MEWTEFWTILSANNIIIDVEQITLFKRYEQELKYWNERVNLISRQDIDNILIRHFMHSLSVLKYIEIKQKARCLDIGTGGGFPGLPIKIARQDLYITLTDSIKKKLKVTEIFAKHTELRNINCKAVRVENLVQDNNMLNAFDVIFARAVAPIQKLIEWSIALLKDNGRYILLKGGNLNNEILDAKEKYNELKFEEINIDFLGCDWFNKEAKKIIVIKK